MAKALVYEGCPACERRSYGRIDYGQEIASYFFDSVKGGAVGAGGVIVADMVLPKLFPTLNPFVRTLLTAGAVMGGAYYLKDRNPELAVGLAVGGGGIIAYNLVRQFLKKSFPALPLSGYKQDIEVEESPYGVIVPEELEGYEEEIIIE